MRPFTKTAVTIMVAGLLIIYGCGKKEKPTSKTTESETVKPAKKAVETTNYLMNPAAALGKARDISAPATLQSLRIALEAYNAENGAYPDVPDDDLGALENALGDYLAPGLNIGGSTPGSLTGYRGSATTYTVTAMGRDSNHFFHLRNDTSIIGPDDQPSLDD